MNKNKKRLIAMFLLSVIFMCAIVYLVINYYESYKNQETYKNLVIEETPKETKSYVDEVKKLQKENSDIKGWIQIKNTKINYPILQTTDNEFYLTHNYMKKESKYGSIFLNTHSDIKNPNSNVIMYGHYTKAGDMFGELLNYQDEKFYKEHPKIMIATDEEESEYEIISVFLSRVFYQDEKDVFRYYSYFDFENEKQYNEYLKNCKKEELYDTGKTAQYGEQLVTLISCEYSQENGRIVIIAKKT